MNDNSRKRSDEFLKISGQFKLGALTTESSHPVTANLSEVARTDIAAALKLLFDVDNNVIRKFREFVKRAGDLGVLDKAFLLAGVTPLKGPKMAAYMRDKVPGMDVPDEIVKRMKGVPKSKANDEGINLACETIAELRGMKGVAGVHLMAVGWEHRMKGIAERAGLLPRPQA